jgi:hypothetical protein
MTPNCSKLTRLVWPVQEPVAKKTAPRTQEAPKVPEEVVPEATLPEEEEEEEKGERPEGMGMPFGLDL